MHSVLPLLVELWRIVYGVCLGGPIGALSMAISETWPADPTGGRTPAAVGIQESTASSPKNMVLLGKWFQNRDAGESRDPNGLYGP